MTFTREQLAWAGGLFEGEGCISFSSSKSSPRRLTLRLATTDEDVLVHFKDILGLGRIYGPFMPKGGKKPAWVWNTTSFEEAQAVIGMLWSFLGSRRRRSARTGLVSYLQTKVRFMKRLKLSSRCKEEDLILMRSLRFEGLSHTEIAKRMSRSPSSISRLLSGSRKAKG